MSSRLFAFRSSGQCCTRCWDTTLDSTCFPAYLSKQAQAESILAYWMLHPNELQAAPARMELLEALRRIVGGREGEFFVFRYQMPRGHWAGSAWVLGLAGPFDPEEKPYESVAGGFSRADDVSGKVSPTELV